MSRFHPICELAQVLRTFFDAAIPHLHFDRSPSTIGQHDHSICFKPCFIPIVLYLGIEGIGIYPEIMHAKGFE